MKANVDLSSISPVCAVILGMLTATPILPQSQPEIRKLNTHTWFLKQLTIESFGYTASPVQPGYEFNKTTTSGYYNLRQLECPLCIPGPAPFSRTRPVLAPFGAKMQSDFWNERLIVFASFGGINGVNGDNTPRLNPNSWRATSNNDNWFVTSEAGSQVYVNSNRTISMGISKGRIQNFGPGQMRWGKTTGAVSLTPALVQQLGRYFKRSGNW